MITKSKSTLIFQAVFLSVALLLSSVTPAIAKGRRRGRSSVAQRRVVRGRHRSGGNSVTFSIGGGKSYSPTTHRQWVSGRYETRTEQVLVEPGHYEWRIERVQVSPGHYEMRYTLPVEKTVYDYNGNACKVVVKPGCTKKVWIPARYEERKVKIWVPACYESRRVRVWVPGCWVSKTVSTPCRSRSNSGVLFNVRF